MDGDSEKRAVVFIKEIVPKPLITIIANTLYNENYETMKMSHAHSKNKKIYHFGRKSLDQSIAVNLENEKLNVKSGSHEEFITEHYWGYAEIDEKSTNEYEVVHPKWTQRKVSSYDIKIDFADIYGQSFHLLNQQKPFSVLYCDGSEVSVENKTKIASKT